VGNIEAQGHRRPGDQSIIEGGVYQVVSLTEVVEIRGVKDGRSLLQPLRRYDPEADRFDSMPVKPIWENQI
jgi:hypothetical protein